MLKLGTGVASLFAGNRDMKDEVLAEVAAIHDVVVENVSYVANSRPLCTLYFACTGVWNENNGLRGRAIGPTIENLTRLGLFHELDFVPVDRDSLIALWMKTREPVKATFSVKGIVALPAVSNSERGYHVFSDVGTKLEFVGFNEAVHVRVATDIFSRIGLTRCLSDPYIPSAGCGDLIS